MSRPRLPTVHNDSSLNKEPIETVYAIANRYHTDWGLKEMPDMKIYPDVCKVKRLITKPVKPPKRGTFIEDLQVYHSKLPGPKYEYQSFWSEPKEQKKTKESSKYIEQNQRKTIISDIISDEKRHPRPGPADYNKEFKSKSIENEPIISQRLKLQHRTNYFEDLISQQLNVPGPGAYNTPSRVVSEHVIKKTKSKSPIVHYPGPNSYSPDDPTYFTFDKKFKEQSTRKPVKNLKKYNSSRPGPVLGQSDWNKGWMSKVSKAPQFSIYYDH
ncbi:unnamed protein product [Paramecium primaurelia]|uniref:Uncharacterized protein n=2 Tax=Paramecium TaxID=5884 RepID=A0A8S1XPN6_9CILI|nr:unnamed protein product [Paramecium primaurelia]CAD8203073.1 unnamed protein product [Paramecium pentaurelia]